MKNKEAPRLSTAQYDIMCVIWDRGESTINEVLEAINQNRSKKLRRSTIQEQMRRLEKKNWLAHRKISRAFYFRALRDREEARAALANDMTDRIFEGSCSALVKSLFNVRKISKKELIHLRQILEQTEEK